MNLSDEAKLIEKLAKIEALFAGATTDGERTAAANARERITAKLKAAEAIAPPIEFRFSLNNVWARQLMMALLRRYNLPVFRYHGQRHTTVMTLASRSFVDDVLWPQFTAINNELNSHLGEVTTRIISQAVHEDTSEPAEAKEPPRFDAHKMAGVDAA